MRKRPTPSAGVSLAERAAAPSWTLARIATWCPSAVAPGPVHCLAAAASRCATETASVAAAASGATVTVPSVPSTMTIVPAGTASRPSTATTHGMPSCRAMIAVWLVGPPSVVASATTNDASSPAVSTGARSSAHRIDGTSGTGTPGSGRPVNSAMTRSRMSRRSVTRSAISPPSWVNIVTNCSTAPTTAPTAGLPSLIRFSAAPIQARSWASVAVVASTSDAAPEALAARSRSRVATAPAAAVKRATSAGLTDSSRPDAWASGSTRGRTPGLITGAYCTPATAGTPCNTVPAGRVAVRFSGSDVVEGEELM